MIQSASRFFILHSSFFTLKRCGLHGACYYLSLFIMSAALVALTGCSADELEEPVQDADVPVEVKGFVSEYQEPATLATRAWQPPTGFSLYDNIDKIGICFTQNNTAPEYGYFFKSSGKWRSSYEFEGEGYYFYGYAPHITGISCSVTDLDGAQAAFSEGAKMTISNLPTVLEDDFCFVVGAKNGHSDYKADNDYSVTGMQQGNFLYTAEGLGEEGSGNYVYLLFDHLYAGLRLKIRVDGTYNALRTIKLKEIEIKTNANTTPIKMKANVTIKLQKTTDGSSPVMVDGSGNEQITFSEQGTEDSDAIIFSSNDGEMLGTSYKSFLSHFMPNGVTKIIMTSTYDVYDKNVTPELPEGNLVRENCKATNTISLPDVFDRFTETKRGNRYTINLTIKPTYLYMLSEPDLNNPTAELTN